MGTSKQRSYEDDVSKSPLWIHQNREVMKLMSSRVLHGYIKTEKL
ncbi:hypothetical protein [Bacillus sp. P14.5]|nr:hypothetical protein [Bacillus sp. P14.5]